MTNDVVKSDLLFHFWTQFFGHMLKAESQIWGRKLTLAPKQNRCYWSQCHGGFLVCGFFLTSHALGFQPDLNSRLPSSPKFSSRNLWKRDGDMCAMEAQTQAQEPAWVGPSSHLLWERHLSALCCLLPPLYNEDSSPDPIGWFLWIKWINMCKALRTVPITP